MMRRWALRLALAAFLCYTPQLSAQNEPDPDPPGVKIGEAAPDFNLVDQHGNRRTLKSLLKEGESLAVVFHRSADW